MYVQVTQLLAMLLIWYQNLSYIH